MSVVSYFHKRLGIWYKFILKGGLTVCPILALLFTIVGNGGCKDVDKVSDTLIFRYNEDETVASLDPAFIKSQAELWIAGQLYTTLVELDSDLQPIPMLAKRWDISQNGLVYKFHLRKDVYFSNPHSGGKMLRTVTAGDVVFSFNRLLNPETASPSAWIFKDKVVKGTNKLQAFTAQDDSTFILTLEKPVPAMLSLLATTYCSIVPKEYIQSDYDFGHKPVGSGPFYLKLWETDVRLVLRKNTNYFEKENGMRLPYFEAINVDFIKNKQTAFMRFVSGEYDFFNGIDGSFKDELLSNKGKLRDKYQGKFILISKPFLNTEYIGFNLEGTIDNEKNVLVNRHLRRALSYALDRKSLVYYLRNGVGVPGNAGFVPPVLLNRKIAGFEYSPVKAAQELKLAGYPQGNGLEELQITTTADYLDMVVFIQKAWSEIGVKVKIKVETGGMLRQLRNNGKLQIFRGSWIADYPDAENYLNCFETENKSPNGPNYTHYSNTIFDNIMQKSGDLNAANRSKLLARADSMMISDAPIMVLYYDKSIRLMQPNVLGLSNDAANRLMLKRVRKR